MDRTALRNQLIFTRQHRTPSSRVRVAVDHGENRNRLLAVAFWASLAILMFGALDAHANSGETPELAAVPKPVAPVVMAASIKQPFEMRGACRDGIAVFTVKNTTKPWSGRGHLRIYDGQSGYMLRERWLRFGEGQSASFHIDPKLAPSARYKISVTLPDRSMTYKKSFRGQCAVPVVEARNARR
ncbi:hypothetical protein [Magnetovibrio sp.]|uniref:hypothetical protein n=1 Tax=Magnetovibrio sp. TaxID=2024836 RepID=UPI002F940DAA